MFDLFWKMQLWSSCFDIMQKSYFWFWWQIQTVCLYFWYLKHCMKWQFLWYSLQCLSLLWNNSLSSMSMLICADKIMFMIKHIIILLSLIIFLNHCMYKISILSLKCLFYFMSCCIAFFCLMQSRTAIHISCIMTENFFQLICIFLLIAVSQLLFCFSCFFVFFVLIIITMSLLSSFLIISIFLNIFWLFFLLIFFTSWEIDLAQFSEIMLRHLMIIFLVRCIRISQIRNDSAAAVTTLNLRAAAYMFVFMKTAVCCFCLLIIVLTVLMSSAMWALFVMTYIIFRDFNIFSLSSCQSLQ